MTKIEFTVPIEPFGKGRPRFSTKDGYYRTYTPDKTREGENLFRACARRAMQGRYPFERNVPLRIEVVTHFSIPKSYSKKRHLLCESGEERPTKKPDIDNIVKAVLDSMNESVFWDDCQVVELSVLKKYTAGEGYIQVMCEDIANG